MDDFDDDLDIEVDYAEAPDLPEPIAEKPVVVKEVQQTSTSSFSLQKLRDWALDMLYQHPNLFSIIKTSVNGAVDFVFGKESAASTLSSTLTTLVDIFKSANFQGHYSLVSAKKGFTYLTHKTTNIGFLFLDVLERFPHKTIKFLDGSSLINYSLPVGETYLYTYTGGLSKEYYIYYNARKLQSKTLKDFLAAEKVKSLNSKFLLLNKNEDKSLNISAMYPTPKPSQVADSNLTHIKQFIQAGLGRSILFYGMPGTGKTTMGFYLLDQLNYKTLVFNASHNLGAISVIEYIIELFDVEAIIIDDFDQFKSTNECLELLENLNRRLRVVIGIANSLQSFHPAILRPGRFDEVILINELDKECILSVLGERGHQYYERVKSWPIAYVQELSKRMQFVDDEHMGIHLEELNDRVERQFNALKGK